MGHTSLNSDTGGGYLAKLKGVIGWAKNGVSQVIAYLVLIDIEGGDEIDIAHMISAQINMHKTGHKFRFLRLTVIVNTLN
jgi:hypothetical protein